MLAALKDRFGEHRVTEIPTGEGFYDLLLLDLELDTPVKVLMTNGFSAYKMPVPYRYQDRAHAELYFCLPSYWEPEELDNPSMNWVYEWINKIPQFAVKNETWLGPGHTFSIGKEKETISPTMKQDHFILVDPILLERALAPIKVGEKEVYFYGIIPIFSDEWDYKQGKGTVKFLRKLLSKGVTEKLDDFRTTTLRSKWRIW